PSGVARRIAPGRCSAAPQTQRYSRLFSTGWISCLVSYAEISNIPVDVVVQTARTDNAATNLPLLIEAKSAGDYTNVNKRRKEEAMKITQLKKTYGPEIRFILFLCGYFDSGYLGYEAAEGIDWVWEHRIDDLTQFGV
ncbi:MAG: XamI family restriction endonuclease, partial [Chloroflexi bacterium]|nr:XamI family restriction endonuclease [Chloroflexota bacterium]